VRTKRFALAGVVAAVIFGASAAIGASVASADNLVPTGNSRIYCSQGYSLSSGICRTDNATVYWHAADSGSYTLESNDRSALTSMLSAQYGPTHLELHYDSTPVFSGSGETDWIYQEGEVEPGYAGWTWCNDQVSTWVCDQHYVKLESGNFLNPKVTCHETGHAVGLTHGSEASPVLLGNASSLGCLRTPLTNITTNALGSSNATQINAAYPVP